MTHLHDDSILSSFQTTRGPSTIASERDEEHSSSSEEHASIDPRDDAHLIPSIFLPKLLRTPDGVMRQAGPVVSMAPTPEGRSSDMDLETDTINGPKEARDRPTWFKSGSEPHPAIEGEIHQELQDDYNDRHSSLLDTQPSPQLAQEEVSQSQSSSSSHSDTEPEIKPRNSVAFRLPFASPIRVRIKRQYRRKGDRVALSDLDPKRVWMKVLDEPPESDLGGDNSDDSLLLVQTS
ncbi:hypothetical protein FRB90_001712 [Tulasnella sp. 427]|nr:hypothetical protein FRB90_001712 [Tulasnella sp. 427]